MLETINEESSKQRREDVEYSSQTVEFHRALPINTRSITLNRSLGDDTVV